MYAPPITAVEKTPQINAVVASVVKDFAPAVKYIRYDIREDWTGEWALYFRVMLSDDVGPRGVSEVAKRVVDQTMDRLDIPNLGMFPHFNFRLESGQAGVGRLPEYNFSGLTARSFEQLIQAAAVRVLGPATTIFGDGPDGAREATYEGRTTYPSPEEPWDGYVVIQAKFRQRPLGGRSDAKWVITQLNEELKKFTNHHRRLRRPDYYVFCTNLVLTPAHGTGSKDRVAQLLEQYTKELSGRGFAIWDYDQLRAYLDAYEDVRNTFAAWITPGDVLAEVMRSLRFSRPNFETVMSAFIQKELLADQYVNLEQAGHSADERTPMAQVFIDLPVALNQTLAPPNETEEKRLKTIVAQVLDVGSQRLAPCEFVGSGGRNDGPGTGRYVLIGGPGQGKTTVSQFLCQLHRTAILKGRRWYPKSSRR